jgi:hypothetical protein
MGQNNIYRFRIEVHTERARVGGLQFAEEILGQFPEAFQELYAANMSILGSCDYATFEDEQDSYQYLEGEWNGVKTLFVRFNMWAKFILAPITVDL